MPIHGPSGRTPRDVDPARQTWGSDAIADLLAAYGFEFVTFTPGSSFRGIEESIVNYADETPRVVETPHEALSIAIAHGYAKATGEPLVPIVHDVVGTLHGAMMLFNAYCDRVPMLVLAGAGPVRQTDRRPFFDWIHAAGDQGDLVRDYVKWDRTPADIDDAIHAVLRGLRIARTPPDGPVYIALDHAIQEGELDEPRSIPRFEAFGPAATPAPAPEAVAEAADRLVDAELPVILTDTAGETHAGATALQELAETLAAPVVHPFRTGTPHRFDLLNTHPLALSGTDVITEADVLLALDVWSPDFALAEVDDITRARRERSDATLIDVGLRDYRTGGLAGDDFRQHPTDLAIAAETERAIPALRQAAEARIDADGRAKRRRDDRFGALEARHESRRQKWQEEAQSRWDETPIALPRVVGELWEIIRNEEWVLVNGTFRGWTYRLWEIESWAEYVGGYSGGGGIGYGIGHAIGAALAYEGRRVPINLQPDGDLMFYPGGLWTLATLDLPMLTVVHNNGSLYNSTAHRMRLAAHRGRDASRERALVGTGLNQPTPDYATMAESMGVTGYGPIEDPDDLAPALERAWADVGDGTPALVDVVCQDR